MCIRDRRKRGQHLQREDRGAIQSLVRQGLSGRAIAKELNCSPTTISNELKRGTPPRKSNKGRAPGYSAKRGEAVYRANRTYSKKPHKIAQCSSFINWLTDKVRTEHWSLDACVGYARLHNLFPEDEMSCTHTLINAFAVGFLVLPRRLFLALLTFQGIRHFGHRGVYKRQSTVHGALLRLRGILWW